MSPSQRIDSPANFRIVAAVRALANGSRMALEGARMLEEALEAGVTPEEIFFESEEKEEGGLDEAVRRVLGRARDMGLRTTEVSRRVLRKLSDLPSTRGLVALATPPQTALSRLSLSKQSSSSSSSLFLLLDAIQDPTNVGAILRSAEAFGVEAVLLTPACANPFSARALRASAGSAFRVSLATHVSESEAIGFARERGATLAGADAHGGDAPEAFAKKRPLVLVIGSEGHGISPELSSALDGRLTIPLRGKVESLNAAAAAAVLLDRLTRAAG